MASPIGHPRSTKPHPFSGEADRTDDVDQIALEQQRSLQFGWMLMRCRRHGGISQPSRIIFPGLRIFHDLENYLRPHRASFFLREEEQVRAFPSSQSHEPFTRGTVLLFSV